MIQMQPDDRDKAPAYPVAKEPPVEYDCGCIRVSSYRNLHVLSGQTDLDNEKKQATVDGINRLGIICVVVVADYVLLLRRALYDAFRPGCNELPSGGLEPNEDILHGMHRELWEEAGLKDPLHMEPLLRYDATYGTRIVRHLAFLVLHHSRDIRTNPREHADHTWCPIDDVASLSRHGLGEDAEQWILEETRRRLAKLRESFTDRRPTAPPGDESHSQHQPASDTESQQGTAE